MTIPIVALSSTHQRKSPTHAPMRQNISSFFQSDVPKAKDRIMMMVDPVKAPSICPFRTPLLYIADTDTRSNSAKINQEVFIGFVVR